jgi:hypothetical protein
MANGYVTKVTLRNNQVLIKIGLDDFTPGESVEISGYATQAGGAFAVFNDIQLVPKKDPDGEINMWVMAPPSADFKKGKAVTVVLRAARVWTTVLGERQPGPVSSLDQDELTDEGMTWDDVRHVKYAAPLSAGHAGHTPTGGDATFPDST